MLVDSGMVRRVKDGNRAYFSIADESLFELCEQVCGSLRRQIAQLDALLQPEGEPAS
jgi:ArsR family transcriptional regulator